MSFGTGFRGTAGGAVQASYTDQPGQAVDGMLMFSSDINLCDAVYVGETDGIAAGRGVKVASGSDTISLQRPNLVASLPVSGDTAAALVGIVVFDEQMQSDANGIPGVGYERMAMLLRSSRVGGRIYVKCPEAVTVGSSTVNWVTVAGTDGLYEAGQFAPAALAGTSAAGTSVSISTATWIQGCSAGGYGAIEFRP